MPFSVVKIKLYHHHYRRHEVYFRQIVTLQIKKTCEAITTKHTKICMHTRAHAHIHKHTEFK